MRLTKNDMARVIVTALYAMPALAAADHPKVINLVKRKADYLRGQHKLAMQVIGQQLDARKAG